jgi:hypothetical protein
MQSVHAGAVQTHFSYFAFSLKTSFEKRSFWLHLESIFHHKSHFLVKQRVPKTGTKKGDPPDSNKKLFPCPEAPGAAASRAHFSNKKQLFEQQLKHCSKFSLETRGWIRNGCIKSELLCNPYTPAQSKHTFLFSAFFQQMLPEDIILNQF